MKSYITLMVSVMVLASGCSHAQQPNADHSPSFREEQILIVYLSRTNNTKAIAQIIQRNVGGNLVSLELQQAYPENYKAIVAQVHKENEEGFLPPLKTRIDDIGQYKTIFIGTPTWDGQLPPPVRSFLHQYKLAGKTIIPFNTNAGYGIGSTFSTIRKLCPQSKVLEGYSSTGGIERDGVLFVMEGQKAKKTEADVKKWLQKLGLLK